MPGRSTSRVFIGRIPYSCREKDLERFFRNYGHLRDIIIKHGYGFVEFDDERDADDAVYELNGKDLLGERVTVEHAKGVPRRVSQREYGRRPDFPERFGPPVRTPYRVIVENLSTRVSWQDLKDFMRKVGEISYADAHRQHRNEGLVEFQSYSDLKRCIDKLDGKELMGRRIRLVSQYRSRSRSRSRSGSRYRSRSRSRSRSRGRRSRTRSRSRSRSDDRGKSRSRSRSRSRSPRSKSRTPDRTDRSSNKKDSVPPKAAEDKDGADQPMDTERKPTRENDSASPKRMSRSRSKSASDRGRDSDRGSSRSRSRSPPGKVNGDGENSPNGSANGREQGMSRSQSPDEAMAGGSDSRGSSASPRSEGD